MEREAKMTQLSCCVVGDPRIFEIKVPRDANMKTFVLYVSSSLAFNVTLHHRRSFKIYKATSHEAESRGKWLKTTDEDISAFTDYEYPIAEHVRNKYLTKSARICEDPHVSNLLVAKRSWWKSEIHALIDIVGYAEDFDDSGVDLCEHAQPKKQATEIAGPASEALNSKPVARRLANSLIAWLSRPLYRASSPPPPPKLRIVSKTFTAQNVHCITISAATPVRELQKAIHKKWKFLNRPFYYYHLFITRGEDGKWLKRTDPQASWHGYYTRERMLKPYALLSDYFDASECPSNGGEDTFHVLLRPWWAGADHDESGELTLFTCNDDDNDGGGGEF